jgi:uncharacterized protein YbcI
LQTRPEYAGGQPLAGVRRFFLWVPTPTARRPRIAYRHAPESPIGHLEGGALRILARYTGREATKATASFEEDRVTVLISDPLAQTERSLVENGRGDLVMKLRQELQEAMRDDLVSMVEGHTGCKVTAYMSTNHIDPDYAVEVFVLDAG